VYPDYAGAGLPAHAQIERVRVRMGVHAGEAELTTAGPVGLDVHRAARIAAVAHGSQVLVSARWPHLPVAGCRTEQC
jgi:class 3 adenylate cyclase